MATRKSADGYSVNQAIESLVNVSNKVAEGLAGDDSMLKAILAGRINLTTKDFADSIEKGFIHAEAIVRMDNGCVDTERTYLSASELRRLADWIPQALTKTVEQYRENVEAQHTDEARRAWEWGCKIDAIKRQIRELELMRPQTPLELESKNRQLMELQGQLAPTAGEMEQGAQQRSSVGRPTSKARIDAINKARDCAREYYGKNDNNPISCLKFIKTPDFITTVFPGRSIKQPSALDERTYTKLYGVSPRAIVKAISKFHPSKAGK